MFLKPFFFAENLSQTDMFLNSSCVEITDGKSMSSCPVSFGHASPELACKFYSSDQYRSYSDLKTKTSFEEHGNNFHEFDQYVLSQGLCY